ncbi:MAG: His/Gly/Thr/Pro-type tRNA ligase C-terminal domain-containing protein [Candidatus Pacebacteria bacterium]|nr:His/Gly/Thr/Pro-type tRNA ligase C-terminal domain-containing protein [Candidatus Paceibacterota bacterium]
MRQSNLFTKTKKETPKGATFISHQLLLRAGFVYQFASGIYALLPLGFRVLQNIEKNIRAEFNKIGIQELRMSVLHPAELWKKTGRWEAAGKELWKTKSRTGEDMALAMTHEETISAIAADILRKENELPFIVNQFSTKVRDEERPRGGLLRLREFLMQDAYSFDKDEKGLDSSFDKMIGVYKNIFEKMDIPAIAVKASAGLMGGADSYEFMVVSSSGEDEIVFCSKCGFGANVEIFKKGDECPECKNATEIKKSIEVGHAFKLGTKYSKAMNIMYEDSKGEKHYVQMGCYGIGMERLIATAVEISHDERGIIWPKTIAPFNVHLLSLRGGEKAADKLYQDLEKEGIEVFYDDMEDKSAGEKFADADLIGIPLRIVVSERTIKEDSVEVKERDKKETKLIKLKELIDYCVSNKLVYVK